MSYRAKQELDLMARIFLVLFAFELITWSFLFNAIFTGDILDPDWSTTGAVLVASIFATGVIWFERQILTADTLRLKPLKKRLAMGTRLIFIAASVLAVAQPVELLLFRLPIQDRAHAEKIRKEAVTQLSMLYELESLEASILEESPEDELKELREKLSRARGKRDGLASKSRDSTRVSEGAESRVLNARNDLERAQQALEDAMAAEDQGAISGAQLRVTFAQRAYEESIEAQSSARQTGIGAAEELASAVGLVADLENREQELVRALGEFKARHALVLQAADRCRNRLRAWIAQLQNFAPGRITESRDYLLGATSEEQELWPDEWKQSLTYSAPSYNFFEQVAVVWDLAWSRPPAWPMGSNRARARLQEDFGLGDQGGGRDSTFYLYAFLGIHVLAAFFPMLIFTIKWFVMPKDLEEYYSAHHQAIAGNPDAIRSLLVDHRANASSPHSRGESR